MFTVHVILVHPAPTRARTKSWSVSYNFSRINVDDSKATEWAEKTLVRILLRFSQIKAAEQHTRGIPTDEEMMDRGLKKYVKQIRKVVLQNLSAMQTEDARTAVAVLKNMRDTKMVASDIVAMQIEHKQVTSGDHAYSNCIHR